jgi:hypothetical protein
MRSAGTLDLTLRIIRKLRYVYDSGGEGMSETEIELALLWPIQKLNDLMPDMKEVYNRVLDGFEDSRLKGIQ